MKLLTILFLLLIVPAFSQAQQNSFVESWESRQLDSMRQEINQTTNDTLRMRMARSLGWHFQELNRDSSFFYHHLQLELARKLKQKLWQADAADQAGWVLSQTKNFPLSLEYFLEAFEITENPDSEKNIWNITIFSGAADPRIARLTVLGFIHNDVSNLYKATGNKEMHVWNLTKGLEIGKQLNDPTLISLTSTNFAEHYLQIDELDSALLSAGQALKYIDISGFETYRGHTLALLGKIYLSKQDYANGKKFLDQAVAASKTQQNKGKLSYTYLLLADLNRVQGKIDSSISYTRMAIENSLSFNDAPGLNQAYASLHSQFKLTGQRDSSLFYLERAKTLTDSLNADEKQKLYDYQNIGFDQQIKLQEQEKKRIQRENSIRIYGLAGGIAVFMIIAFLLYRNSRSRRKANELLQQQKSKIESTLTELKATQSQLIQSEKMASLGELTAGIAHEIQNPLNFVNNFSELSNELLDEMKTELNNGNIADAKEIADNIFRNLEKINHHGKRADAIVKGMLQHSQSSAGVKEKTDVNKLADEYLRLAYHGLRAKDKSFNATLNTEYDETIGNINIIPQDIGRVILNLITNAFYAVDEKKKSGIDKYEPLVSISTKKINNTVEIKVTDNGNGIPSAIKDKIFQPFFTTKPTGQGTGLGLSLAYDIIKAHGGELLVASTGKEESEGIEGTSFIVILPK